MAAASTPLAHQLAGLDITVSQSRFHKETINDPASKDIDIRDLTLAWGQRELLSHANLHLQANSHYVLAGRNGTGKSSVLSALARGSIPGIPSNIKIVYIGQGGLDLDDPDIPSSSTVLDRVVKSDKYRERLLDDQRILSSATEQSLNALASLRAYRDLRLRDLLQDLSIVAQVATYRSGARGFKARKELKAMEATVEHAKTLASQPDDQIDADTIAAETSAAADRLADVEAKLASIDSETPELRAGRILKGLGFQENAINAPFDHLSGGWRTRCSIASGLFQSSDILLLDEPTNFLDLPAIIWLKTYINSLTDKTVVTITHDRDFGDSISSTLLLLKDAAFTVFHGTLSSYIRETRKQARHMTKMKDAQDKAEQHIKQQISHNVQAAKKSGDDKKLKQAASRKKKLDERMGLEVGLKGGRFKLNRDLGGYHLKARADIEVPQFDPPPKLSLPQPSELKVTGNLISLEAVGFFYRGAKRYLLHDTTVAIGPGDRIGLVGLNGAGKSTLVKLILGPELDPAEGLVPSKGTVQRHPRMRVGHFSQQSLERLERKVSGDEDLTALKEIMSLSASVIDEGLPESQARALLSGLGLAGRVASDVPIRALSGGQKVRVALASQLIVPPHLLILDEVTCHLDADTVTALADTLKKYQGALLLVSHDRFFIRSVVEGSDTAAQGDETEGSEDESESDDEGAAGARKVLLVEKGGVKVLARGVQQYEESCEKKMRKMQ